MRLADFIEGDLDTILAEWVAFAESCGIQGATMNVTELRDHALAMLKDMVADLRTPQTRSRLGATIPITRKRTDLAKEAGHIGDDIQAAHDGTVIDVKASGDLVGNWDCPRISQVLTNLLGNAIQHGVPQSTFRLTVRGEKDHVTIQVHNWGPAIHESDMKDLFSPYKRLKALGGPTTPTSSLGLGLYIAERIVSAQRGTLTVTSSESAGTLFSVRLPRSDAA